MFTIGQIVQNIFKKSILRYYVIIIVLCIMACYFIGKKIQMPYFYNNIIKTVVFENQKIAAHILTHNCINDSSISLNDELNMLRENFKLRKIKFYDTSNTVIASTNFDDIGIQNNDAYFINNLKHKEAFFKNIPRGRESFEKEVVEHDVLEIYYPLYLNDEFKGVIEIYYDMAHNLEEFDEIIHKIDTIFIIIVILFILLFCIILYRLSLSDLNRQRNEDEIEELNQTLKAKVKQRTLQLQEKNKQLKKLANFDSLTGVYNRGFFLNLATKYFDIAKRQETSLYIISFDLDHFKNINDTYGHAVGDKVLKKFTKVVSLHMRKSDIFGRIGGEEFVACIQNVKEEGALLFAQKICKEVAQTPFLSNELAISFTVSIGIAKLTNENNIDEIIEKSDNAMYEAKEAGRNRVVYHKEG